MEEQTERLKLPIVKVVGGDAYNFIIYATRGTALVCIGIVCAVLSVTFAIFHHTTKRRP
jgi:hypothetical protein